MAEKSKSTKSSSTKSKRSSAKPTRATTVTPKPVAKPVAKAAAKAAPKAVAALRAKRPELNSNGSTIYYEGDVCDYLCDKTGVTKNKVTVTQDWGGNDHSWVEVTFPGSAPHGGQRVVERFRLRRV